MKKILTAILVIAMIASIASISAFAYDPVQLSGEAITAKAGDKNVKMNVHVSGIPKDMGLAACTIIIADTAGLEIKSIKNAVNGTGTTGDGETPSFMWANMDGIVVDEDADELEYLTEMDVATITFKEIPADAAAGTVYTIKIEASSTADNYLTVEEDAAAGKAVGLGATVVADGTITIVSDDNGGSGNGGTGDNSGNGGTGDNGGNNGGNTGDNGNTGNTGDNGGNNGGNTGDNGSTNNGGNTGDNGAANNGGNTGDNGAANNGGNGNAGTPAGNNDAGKTDDKAADNKTDDTKKADDTKATNNGSKTVTKAGPTGDAAIIVIAAMIVALGTAIVVKKVNIK